MTEPHDPYAVPESDGHPQEQATRPLPVGGDTAGTPADAPWGTAADPSRYPAYQPSAQPGSVQPVSPYQQATGQAAGYVQHGAPQPPSPQLGDPRYGDLQAYPAPGYPAQTYPGPAHPTPPYPQAYAQPRYVVRPPTNGLAIASLVLGILWLSWVGSILALIFGYVALGQIRSAPPQSPQQGHGLALAGVVLGWVGVATLAAIVLFALFLVPASASLPVV
ncbi:DUF4190 domain-containing protein [Isoptericola aurantiacus]|uniref:DUF4190 domain-containing protein n=1 Tax=Isoptericola aurantiacus TaxID=3377839 RepID=UPI00383AB295